jgi:cytochrome c551/c552
VIGPVRGADTTQPPPQGAVGTQARPKATVVATAADTGASQIKALLDANSCTACHGMKQKIVGPGFSEIAVKHKGQEKLEAYLAVKIREGGVGVFGAVPMPAQPQLSAADAGTLARWIAAGAQ